MTEKNSRSADDLHARAKEFIRIIKEQKNKETSSEDIND